MNEKYVTNLELSKQLRAAGCPQKSEFWWFHQMGMSVDENGDSCEPQDYGWKLLNNKAGSETAISAYLSDELLEMLPKQIDKFSLLIRYKDWGEWEVSYTVFEIGLSHSDIKWWERNKSLPIALAKTLLYLHKEGLVKW